MGKREWLGAALAAFGVGCGEGTSADARGEDAKDAKIEKAQVGQDEVVDDELFVPDEKVDVAIEKELVNSAVEHQNGVVKKVDSGQLAVDIESETVIFKNVLEEEADSIRPGKWMGDKYDDEVKRLKVKLPKELSKNKFDDSLEQLHKFLLIYGI